MTESNYRVGERRPIGSRQWGISRKAATALARLGVSANAISVSGMIAGVLAGLALAYTSHGAPRRGWVRGALCIQRRRSANMLDGMVAVERGSASSVGELYNEVPDRVSDAAIIIGAGYAAGSSVTLGYIAACVALFVAYVRAQGKAAGAPHEFCGPMAKQHRMAVLTLTAVLCAISPQGASITWQNADSYLVLHLPRIALAIIILGGLVTAVRRLFRIAANLGKRPA